ncbi:hypothetical protein CBER1_07141 [Cercospora berteroae]|uniref:Uncharacterized protein n=1 Tax=Cercospora berteroae TaxID=357750 RepID=A0A2S6CFM8_9PEZI|nr:hypothetical protein CBER1_07141 [Cercospora berteroae]
MATQAAALVGKPAGENQSSRMHPTIPNYRARRVEEIKQKVRRHQQAAERRRITEEAAPAYLQHHGRISTCTPEAFLRKRKPVLATASILSGDFGYAFHNPSNETESNAQSAPTEACSRTPEPTEPRTPIKVPERSDSFDENYDLTPRYMRRYLTPEARARPEPDPRRAGFNEENSPDFPTSMLNIGSPHRAFPAPSEPSAYVSGPPSPLDEKRRGLFRRARAAPQLPRQPVVPATENRTPKPRHDATGQKWSSVRFLVQPSNMAQPPASMQSFRIAGWQRPENGRDGIVTASPDLLERGAMSMNTFLDTVLCILALGLVVVAGAGTMSTFIALVTAPASW